MVFVVALCASLLLRSARNTSSFAFPPSISPIKSLEPESSAASHAATFYRPRAFCLSMVSQKEKKRRQEDAQRREASDQLHLVQAQAALVLKLKELKENRPRKKNLAKEIKKTIKDAQHRAPELQNNIGHDALLFALKLFYENNRPLAMLDLLNDVSTVNEQDDLQVVELGLWASGKEENWSNALPFAERLFVHGVAFAENGESLDVPASELQGYAIQAFANNGRYIEKALELWENLLKATNVSKNLAKASVNSILDSHLNSGNVEEFKNLFQDVISLKMPHLLNGESYDKALKAAASTGDVSLMERVLETQVTKNPSRAQKQLVLETLAKKTCSGDAQLVPNDLLEMSVSTLKDMLASREKTTVDPEFLSRLICAIENVEEVVQLVSLIRGGNMNLKSGSSKSPLLSLNEAARARILPVVTDVDGTLKTTHTNSSDVGTLYLSLVKTDKSGEITRRTRELLRQQHDMAFFLYVIELSYLLGTNRLKVMASILEEFWSKMFRGPVDEDNMYMLDLMTSCLYAIIRIPKEKTRVELFSNILNQISVSVSKAGPVNLDDLPQFENDKIKKIVHSTVRWLRLITGTLARHRVYQDISAGVYVALTAMSLVRDLEVGSFRLMLKNDGPADNGAKEALKTIAKELLLSNVVESDAELAMVGVNYYGCLVHVSQSSSVLDYDELLFPEVMGDSMGDILQLPGEASPYDNFRKCVLGEDYNKKDKSPGNLLLPFAASISDGEEVNYASSGYPLKKSIIDMARLSDLEYGTKLSKEFDRDYRNFLVDWTPAFFLDFELSCRFFKAYKFQVELRNTTSKYDKAMDESSNEYFTLDDHLIADITTRLKRLSDARVLLRIIDEDKEPEEEKVRYCVLYLLHIYYLARELEQVVGEGANRTLHKDYMDACWTNTAFLVDSITKVVSARKAVEGRVKASKAHVMMFDSLKSMERFFLCLSKLLKEQTHYNVEENDSQKLVQDAFDFFACNLLLGSKADTKEKWLANEAILPEVRKWIKKSWDEEVLKENLTL